MRLRRRDGALASLLPPQHVLHGQNGIRTTDYVLERSTRELGLSVWACGKEGRDYILNVYSGLYKCVEDWSWSIGMRRGTREY